MQYRDRSFAQRFNEMGDQAEGHYERIKPLGNTIRFGWNRPKGINFKNLPTVLRHKPDYFAESGYLVEVVGLGKDGILKSIKTDKFEALRTWAKIAHILGLELVLFVWNSHEQTWLIIEFSTLRRLITKSSKEFGILSFANDGNQYHPLPWEWLTTKALWIEEADAEEE